ncbi:hypothetical protein TCSYLVIO_009297 [Trypanosoma cruzi]|nr:hypothetical protein TCSYLVIO_009297 [Trypanosoma cruzi]
MPRHRNAACMTAPRCMFLPGPSHPSCWWRRVQTPRRGLVPGIADKYSPLQITAAAFLTSSAGSVMGQLSIGRFADPSWIIRLHTNHWNTDPTCSVWQELPLRRTCSNIHSCSVRSASSAAVHSPNSSTSASAPPSPTSPSCSPGQPMRPASAPCGSRHNQSVPSTHPSRGAATSATPASSRHHRHPAAPRHQCRRCRGASSQPSRQSSSAPPPTAIGAIHSSFAWRCDQCDSSVLPSPSSSCSPTPSMSSLSRGFLAAITAVVECTTTDSALPRTAPCQHWQHQWNNAQHAP